MACFPQKKGRAKLETCTEAEVIWQDALIARSGGQRRWEELVDHGGWGAERSGDVGQNVKLELIRAHRRADEWLIVVADRQRRRNNLRFVRARFTSPSAVSSPRACR